jgi:hypothetical protein
MPKIRTPLSDTISGLRRIETTLRTAGSDGCTMSDLTSATGLVRRTIDRNLRALIELGCEITHDQATGSTPRTWRLTGRTVFSGGERR